ncbi:hypothetical protein B566_EDAN011878 [Ephemera danica]|nr:hypothetical protein B566_EDAN011878 [Ephemera danica]
MYVPSACDVLMLITSSFTQRGMLGMLCFVQGSSSSINKDGSSKRSSISRKGSSGSSGSGSSTNLGAKSAPPTPHGDRLQPGGPGGAGGGGGAGNGGSGGLINSFPSPASSPAAELPPPVLADIPPRSPSFSKHEKLKIHSGQVAQCATSSSMGKVSTTSNTAMRVRSTHDRGLIRNRSMVERRKNNLYRQALKQLSTSTPSMTTAESEPPAPTPPGSSKARQKKFHRHFKQVPPEERVLNYYSCALVSDILLQGHLYITKNYFAFYSNVFGYVTKLLIPTATVLKVSKEKTAKIIPNAVGITTINEKHVFGSLLSRDATYKLMIQVWKSATEPEELEVLPKVSARELDHTLCLTMAFLTLLLLQLEADDAKDVEETSVVSVDAAIVDDEDSSLSGDDSAIERSCSPTPIDTPTDLAGLTESKRATSLQNNKCTSCGSSRSRVRDVPDGGFKPAERRKRIAKVNGTAVPLDRIIPSFQVPSSSNNSVLPRPTVVLMLSTVLLVALFFSAAFLLFRISAIQAQFATHPVISSSDDIYQEILKWQIQLHSKSSSEVQQFLNSNLDQIAKVRQSLEALSLLLVTETEERHRFRGSSQPRLQHPQQQQQQQQESADESTTVES